VQPSSFVFVAIVALWAAYLLPQWIRRRDALGASRGSDRHSLALRVLERRRRPRRPGPSSPPLLTPAPSPAPTLLPKASLAPSRAVLPSPTRAAARRRAIVLAGLTASTVLAAAGAVAGVVPGDLLVVSAGLLIADLAVLRLVQRARARRQLPAAAHPLTLRGERRAGATWRLPAAAAPSGLPVLPRVPHAAETVAEETVAEETVAEETVAEESVPEPVGRRTWVPVPVPPPTYTLKPMVPRPEPAPLETLIPAASASGPAVPAPAAPRVHRRWVGEEQAAVDLDSVLRRRRAVNG
jgi:hypothetical protein